MVRLAIINHETHQLFIEDVTDEMLEKYGGEEEAYIKDNYTFEGEWSWEYIVDIEYYCEENADGIAIEPTNFL